MERFFLWGSGRQRLDSSWLSGRHVATPESDLDIVLYAERRMTAEEAKFLCDRR